MCKKLMMALLLCSGLLTQIAAQDFKAWQLSLLTTPKGWVLQSQTILSPYHPPGQLTRNLTDCIPDECLVFKSDGTYTRTFIGSNCSGIDMPGTHGKWTYQYDDKVFQDCILSLQLDDEVNNLYDQKWMVISTAPEYGMLMLTRSPDEAAAYSHEILIYKPRDFDASKGGVFSSKPGSVGSGNSAATTSGNTTVKQTPTASNPAPAKALSLREVFAEVKQNDMPVSKTLEEAYEIGYVNNELGVIAYDDLMTGTGPYHFAKYTMTDKRVFYADIISDYAGSSLLCYELTDGLPEDITSKVIDPKLEGRLLTEGFTWWNNQWFDGQVPATGSEKSVVYSLPADNFITKNPHIYVELRVIWEENGEVIDESRVLGQLTFNGKNFQFSWYEE